LSVALSACATKDPEAVAQRDPWEPTNRAVFDFDVKLDRAVARPVAKFYNHAVPQPARTGIHNALANLNSPVVFGNDVLQGEPGKATNTLGRFVINSTVGLAGFIDVAGKIGIPGHTTDFGITLGKAGAQEGSYLVLPLLGPKPPRDLVGMGVDTAMDPLTWISFNNSTFYLVLRGGVGVLDERAATVDQVEQIERSSIDFYATTRSLYRQSRAAQINNGKAPDGDLPNF
jgi:phospholipid-binding lipoprotein MlaA